jgi:hypothetical protein
MMKDNDVRGSSVCGIHSNDHARTGRHTFFHPSVSPAYIVRVTFAVAGPSNQEVTDLKPNEGPCTCKDVIK